MSETYEEGLEAIEFELNEVLAIKEPDDEASDGEWEQYYDCTNGKILAKKLMEYVRAPRPPHDEITITDVIRHSRI